MEDNDSPNPNELTSASFHPSQPALILKLDWILSSGLHSPWSSPSPLPCVELMSGVLSPTCRSSTRAADSVSGKAQNLAGLVEEVSKYSSCIQVHEWLNDEHNLGSALWLSSPSQRACMSLFSGQFLSHLLGVVAPGWSGLVHQLVQRETKPAKRAGR